MIKVNIPYNFFSGKKAQTLAWGLLGFLILLAGSSESPVVRLRHLSEMFEADSTPSGDETIHIYSKLLPTSEDALPAILGKHDREAYKEILNLQSHGDFAGADDKIKTLNNRILVGNILADRYLGGKYKPSANEVKAWLENYSDLSQADQIYQKGAKIDQGLAAAHKVENTGFLKGYGENNGLSARVESMIPANHWSHREKAAALNWKKFNELVKKQSLSKAAILLEAQKVLWKPYEQDVAKWSLASAYFAAGKDREASRLAEESAKRSGSQIPGVYWTAGISAWRLGNIEAATKNFAYLAGVKGISGWEKSAAAFWAYRGYSSLDDSESAHKMLKLAAENQYTFYGLLARRAINQTANFEWKKQPLTASDIKYLATITAVQRSLALTEIGLSGAAENELRKYYPTASNEDKVKLMGLADKMKMPGLQVRIASSIRQEQGDRHDYANYPIPEWKPTEGYKVEPALIFALMRHESGFNPNAVSNAGAIGLMQMMPETAAYMAEKKNADFSESDLLMPEVNITLAQDYVQHLLSINAINGNLFFFAAAYNAGPGKLSEWQSQLAYKNDPLLFMESIPSRETRSFIEQVVANYWIYCKRLEGSDSRTMDMVLNNSWPVYTGSVKKADLYLTQISQN